MDRKPKPGTFYRHFKNKLYQVLAVAEHSETGEEMVVYQALYGDFRVYVRPLDMFISPVDREQYPNAVQEYRFEQVKFAKGSESVMDGGHAQSEASVVLPLEGADIADEDREPNPYLMDFLGAENYEQQLNALVRMRGKVGQQELDSIAMSLDIRRGDGSLEEQLEDFARYVRTQKRYDGTRLR